MLPLSSWVFPDGNKDNEAGLVDELHIHPVVARIMTNRNIHYPDGAKRFLSPSLDHLHNPFLLRDMEKAVQRTIDAITAHSHITIYGDYDADGITSTALLLDFFRKCHTPVSYYIPDRIDEGYGLNKRAVDRIAHNGASLIITVDCGISDKNEIAYAHSLGIDTIVLDHHEIQDIPLHAAAVINPHRTDNDFPFRDLAGVGVAFNFLIALRGRLRYAGFWNNSSYPNLKEYLDLVALGTIADLVPLVDENRIFVKYGLEIINSTPRTGIRALILVSNMNDKTILSETAAFTLIPRINAAGRIGSPADAVEMLTAQDLTEAITRAERLDSNNTKRKDMENAILTEILARIATEEKDAESNYAIVFSSEKWHPGVIGIVASRLVDRFYRPTVLFSLKDGVGKGSARSISEFNLYSGLQDYCSSLLLSFGGHQYAAGLSIRDDDIDDFACQLNSAVRDRTDGFLLTPQTHIDATCPLETIDHRLMEQLALLEPFGYGNPEPLLCSRDTTIASSCIVGNNHLKMKITASDFIFDSIWFNMGTLFNELSDKSHDIIFTPQINNWNNRTTIQLKLKDMAKRG